MPPTGKKPFPLSPQIQALDTEAQGRYRYEDGSLGPKKKGGPTPRARGAFFREGNASKNKKPDEGHVGGGVISRRSS